MKLKPRHLQMYMRIAEAVAETSSAVRLKVGAVAVKNNMVIGTGYNGLPSGVDGDCEYKTYLEDELYWLFDGSQEVTGDTIQKLKEHQYPYEDTDNKGHYKLTTRDIVRHGECNLLLNLAKSTESSKGAIIFCTHACCKHCAMDIVDSGVEKFYYRHNYRSTEGVDYLRANNVEVEQI